MDRIGKEYIRGREQVGRFRDMMNEARLRWFGQVQMRDVWYSGRRMLRVKQQGRRGGIWMR